MPHCYTMRVRLMRSARGLMRENDQRLRKAFFSIGSRRYEFISEKILLVEDVK